MKITTFALAACLLSVSASAEVVRVEVTSQQDIPEYGYVQITGKVRFAVDPKDPRNAVIADIDKAPKNAEGKVEFSSDILAYRPKNGIGNGVALVDVVNRGNTTAFRLNRASGADRIGDGFLMKQGFTIICIGWEFDVAARNAVIRIDVPVATENGAAISGTVHAAFTPDRRDVAYTMTDVAAYPPADVDDPDARLTVRNGLSATFETIPRSDWKIAGNVVTMQKAFEPGRNYEISYRAANPPVSGLGLAAVRDIASHTKYGVQQPLRYAIGFGVSQSGRFLRTFLYEGMNTDEKGRKVFDSVMAHIAGAARLDVNRRWATPTGLGTYAATGFPFADMAQKDPVSGVTDGLLDNPRARTNQPKIFYTNTGVEYWGGGRSAALIHTTADGGKDIALPANVRTYFFAGNQHRPAAFPPPEGQGQQKANPTDYWWNMRALVLAMDRWVREGKEPPPSQYPQLGNGSLVKAATVAFSECSRRAVAAHLDARTADVRRTRAWIGRRGRAAAVPRAPGRPGWQRARRRPAAGSHRAARHVHRLEFPQQPDRRDRPARLAARFVYSVRADEGRTRGETRSASVDRGALRVALQVRGPDQQSRC